MCVNLSVPLSCITCSHRVAISPSKSCFSCTTICFSSYSCSSCISNCLSWNNNHTHTHIEDQISTPAIYSFYSLLYQSPPVSVKTFAHPLAHHPCPPAPFDGSASFFPSPSQSAYVSGGEQDIFYKCTTNIIIKPTAS